MTDKPKDHTASAGGASAPSPFDQPTERFAAQSIRTSNPTRKLLPQTDEDLDFGAPDRDSLPTEEIPAFRRLSSPAPSTVEDQPTVVIARGEPVVSEPVAMTAVTEPIAAEPTVTDRTVAEPVVSEPILAEPVVSEPIGSHTGAGPVVVPPAEPSEDSRRGTLDLGLLVLRAAVGGTLLVHGLQKLTGWWNGPGLGGYRDQLVDSGFDHARALAMAGAVGEVAGGALLILGLLTPVAAAVVLAVMINAWCLKQSMVPGLEYFAPEGIEYETVLGAAAAAIILTGPGRISLDGRRKWATRPYVGSAVVLILGVAVGVGVWFLFNGANPVI
ncbi:DoxX family membrane protein [Rhodococcus sp. ACT016]|uniref:DoxX family protein n=1 Tax=Rhodococcus sp. ACT016 TaxID=3134808 RepID=UPI003D2AD28C